MLFMVRYYDYYDYYEWYFISIVFE